MSSRGLWTLFRRESLRFLYNWKSDLLPTYVTNVLYIVVFGSILGGRIDMIKGFPYIQFILPGIIVLGAILNAFNNSAFSVFHGRWDNYINEVLTSPMAYWEMVASYTGAAVLRGMVAAVAIYLAGLALTPMTVVSPLIALGFLFLTVTLFGAVGVIAGLLVRDFGDLSTVSNFVISPLIFLGGVFFSPDMLAGVWKSISLFNPFLYIVNGVRYGLLGYSDVNVLLALSIVVVMNAVAVALALSMFKRGVGLRA